MRRKLIFIIGQSGSGKDTVADYLASQYGWHRIASYTTRERRPSEQNGREHTFLTWGEVAHDPRAWCEHRGLHLFAQTLYGGHYYFTACEQMTHYILPARKGTSHKDGVLHDVRLKSMDPRKPVMYIIDEKGLLGILQNEGLGHWLHDNFDFELWSVRRNDTQDVGSERTDRDEERIAMPDSAFKHIIPNHYDLDYLYSYIDAIIKNCFQ